MQISVIRPSELGPSEIAVWHSMQHENELLANPFLCPEFTIAVGNFRPDARVAVLFDGTKIVGFFPFERRRLGAGMPIGAGLTDCQGLIHSRGVEWDAPKLLRACRLSIWQFDHLVAGQRPFDRYVTSVASSSVIDLSDGFSAYHERLRVRSAKFCRQIASKARILERDFGELHFNADSRDLDGLRQLMSWKSEQYHRTGFRNIFDIPWVVGLVDYLFSTRSDRFSGQLSLMYAGESLISAQFDIRSEHLLAGWMTTYDRSFGNQSPGLIHHLRKAKGAYEMGIRLIDLGKGTEPYKQKFKNHEIFVAEGVASQVPLIGAVHRARNGVVRWAGLRIRRHPYLFRMADKVRRRSGNISY